MTSAESSRPRPLARRRRGPLIPTIVTIVVLVVGLLVLSQLWTQVLWFNQLGFGGVLWTQWGTRVVLFVLGFLVMAGAVAASLQYAYRSRPVYAPSSTEQANLDQYREAIEPLLERLDGYAYVLCRTSHPGAGELQDFVVAAAGDAPEIGRAHV